MSSEKRTKVTEEEEKAIGARYKTFMQEIVIGHTPAQIGKHTSVAESTVNRVKREGASPSIKVLLSLGRFLGISPVLLFSRIADEPLPNASAVKPDRSAILRDLDEFAAAIEKQPLLQRMEMLDVLSDSIASAMRKEAGEE